MSRIVVFTGDPSYSVRKGIVEIDRAIAGIEWLIVCYSRPRTFTRLARSQWLNLRRHGWRWIPHLIGDVGRRIGAMSRSAGAAADGPGWQYSAAELLHRANVHHLETTDLHALQTLEKVRFFAPDLGLSLSAPLLQPCLFEIPRCGTLNLHKGRLPDYRGMPPAFWELWNDEAFVGCTVHRVNAKLDKGDTLIATGVHRDRYSTLKGLQLMLDELGIALTTDAVRKVLNDAATYTPQPTGGHTYRKPTLKQFGALQRRLRAPLPQSPNAGLRGAVKNAALQAALTSHSAWRSLRNSSPTVTVILYHRVSDKLRDSLTVGIEQFDRQMSLLRRYCCVVSIDDVVSGKLPRNGARPIVCVTFDDGYKDNYQTAVPLLLRHCIPAAFFVSTGYIGTSETFPHDQGKVREKLDNMTWDDLREMKRLGFVIGSHTVSHVDCASAPEDLVNRELHDSRTKLRSELDIDDVMFAYPFGGRHNMTPERLELVKAAGYVACLSAYGGFNRGPIDPFNVLRCGVNWAFSDIAFRCRAAGIR